MTLTDLVYCKKEDDASITYCTLWIV